MRVWPVPESYQKSVPASGQPGSFWENRGDRRHAGVDIYAPENSYVLAIEDSVVQSIRPFTSPTTHSYWHPTLEILLRTDSGSYHRYCELKTSLVVHGDQIKAGAQIGLVGMVLNSQADTTIAPQHVKNLILAQKCSMLHFEMYSDIRPIDHSYSGGNYFLDEIPFGLIDPSHFLETLHIEGSRNKAADGFVLV